ncbi:TPA: hypothetical protein ACNHQ5_004528 [Escherichia coli]|uniref:hypothetical protein n=1 Tax=Bradyrhizobium sp. TaxID=376 RepID=UPI0025C6475A|nr:hypothetical protein [Bradyrhizobium sp.]MCA3567288.1 hypothetical protein [Bradyrhizobium sp.]MCA3575762.1 hypothetical protein [Bradyrhizobium sp.]
MASPFSKAFAAAAATLDQHAADPFEYRPCKLATDVNAPTVADPDRVVKRIAGTFGEYAARVGGGPFNQPGVQPERPGVASSRPYLSIRLAQLPYRPRTGDQIAALDDNGAPIAGQLFRVAEVLPSTPGYARLDLNRIK